MENIKFIEVQNPTDGIMKTFVFIDRGNDEYTTMPKATYDAMQAEQSTPNLTV
jgi:predicted aspartyl protease